MDNQYLSITNDLHGANVLLAPNGKPSNLTPEQYFLVRTTEFKEWFGDWEKLAMAKVKDSAMDEVTLANLSKDVSKVVDQNGEPLVVYHGTPYEFTIFKKDKPTIGVYGQGFYFTNDKGFASNYAKIEGSKILTCFLNVKKIFEIDNDELPIGYEKYSDMADNKGKSRDFTIKLKSLLYDGVFAKNTYNENEFVVFEPEQIKLADGSNTTFDGSNPDIRFDGGGEVKAKFGDKYPKNQFIQLNENDIEYFANDLFDLIQNAYSHLGGHIEFSNIDSFKKTDLNFWIASDIDDDPNADVLLGGKYTDKGIKITLGGQDGNRLAKATMVSKMKDLMKQKGFYTEMDEELAKKLKLTPIQDFEEITKVLDKKEIKNLGNGVYERMIGGKLKQKVLVGLPSGRIDKSQKIQFDLGGKLFNNGGNMKKVDSGGITYGASHDNGGIPVKNASTGEMLEVEGGEGIVNKRSMASDKMVKLNGKEMSICEAVSKLNQMEGGVKFSCDDVEHRQFIEEMEYGGELERGERTEMEHIKVLKDLYAKRITPKQATKQIAKDHIKENPNYYTELSKIEKKMANGGKSDCGCSHHTTTKFSQGGQSDCGCGQNRFDNGGFVRGKGTIEDLIRSKSKQGDKTKEVITDTIIEARNLLDVDYLPIIKKNNFEFYNKYCVGFAHLNLYKIGWRFQFGTSREWAGLCDSRDRVEITRANLSKNKNLYVSINFVKHDANWSKNSKDVILHEIAHALVTEVFEKKMSQGALQNLDPKHFLLEGHGELWATMCKAINQDGSCSRFYANALLQESFKSYMYNCANCRTQRYSNSSTFTKNCFKCGSPVLVVKSKI